jgi:hypothetical protein
MGYQLEAVLAPGWLLTARAAGHPVVALEQGMALLPMTERVLEQIVPGGAYRAALGFVGLPEGFDRVLAEWSIDGPVGYVEADFLGWIGAQRAAVWHGGALVLGPVRDEPGRPGEPSAICRALARLGVSRAGTGDEFDAVGLGRHRSTEDWAEPG